MFLLSGETGKAVLSDGGQRLGRLQDLSVRIGSAHPTVHRLVVGGHAGARHLVPWSSVAALEPDAVRLTTTTTGTSFVDDSDLDANELLLRRDVLDTQIFDANRHRMTRVSDVLLTLVQDGSLEVAAVDVGVGAVVRRLGMRRLGSRLREEAVDWGDLHLTSDRGHDIQLGTPTAAVHRLDARGLAELLTELNLGRAHEVIRRIDPERAADALAFTHPDVRVGLLPAMGGRPAQVSIHGARVRARRFVRLAGWRRNRPSPQAPQHNRGSDDLDL